MTNKYIRQTISTVMIIFILSVATLNAYFRD